MRIAFTTDYYPPHIGGGVESVVFETARRLADSGHNVLVITLGSRDWPGTEVQDRVLVRRFPAVRLNRVTGLELSFSLKATRAMKDTIRQFAPDVVNAHHLYFTTTPPALRAARDLSIPTALTLHVAGMESFDGWKGATARLYGRSMAGRLVGRADALVAVSQAVAASVRPYTAGPVTVIHNGVDLDRFYPGSRPQRSSACIVFVGRLIANKGPDTVLSAFREVHRALPETRLVMVGDGPMRRRLEGFVRTNRLAENVEFLGLRGDVADLLRESDVFVRPSLVEGMPLTVLEAMACGLPVVASDVGGVREVVTDGRTGYLVPARSPAAVADALIRLLRDEELRRKMGEAAQRHVRGGFSWDTTAAATAELFSGLISAQRD